MKALYMTLALACSFVAACGAAEDDLCDFRADCEGWGARRYDECLHDYDELFDRADRRDCLDRYDALIDCEEDTAVCDGRHWDTSCGYERDALNRCL